MISTFGFSSPKTRTLIALPRLHKTTMNNSSISDSNDVSSCPAIVPVLITVALCTIILAALIDNFLVIAAVAKMPRLRTSTNYYIINMAVSDFINSLTNWPQYATDKVISYHGSILRGSLATIACKLGIYVRMASQIVSIFSLVLIAVDRFIATVVPLKATMVAGWIRVALIVSTWVIALPMSYPVLHYSKVVEEGHQTFCKNTLGISQQAIYYTTGLVIVFIAPLVVIIILYTRIMKSLGKTPATENGVTVRGNTQTRRHKQNRNIMKIFRSIVCAFFICWTPFCIYILLRNAYPALFRNDTCKLIVGISYYVMPSLSTAVNPVILFSFSTNFREALKSLYCGLCFRCKCRVGHRSRSSSLRRGNIELQGHMAKPGIHVYTIHPEQIRT